MKYYKSYLDRQELSPAVHERLLDLEPPKKRSVPWLKYGALAACAALIIGVGAWRLAPAPAPAPDPVQPDGPLMSDSASLPEDHPLQTDTSQNTAGAADFHGFVVTSPTEGGQPINFFAMPAIAYPDLTESGGIAASIALPEGSFMADLEKEDIQRLFWPEGKPENTDHDLPWTLFWDGYTVHGYAWYDGQGKLFQAHIFGKKDRASFQLTLCPGHLPLTCCIDMNRGDTVSDAFGVEVTGWSQIFDQDGDGVTDYICGSEFMTKNDIGVKFESRNNGRAEDGVDGEAWFNTLLVRRALTEDGGLYLDHLMTNENIPAWREEEFSNLAQARQEADFAPYLPSAELTGEFYGRLSYQEGSSNTLWVRWSRGYDDVEIAVYRDGTYPYHLVDPEEPETYDLRLYPIPWCDSVPDEYRETVNDPAFKAEDMSLAVVEARGREHDTGGMTWSFDVLHPDGTLVSYRCDGMTAEQVWALVEETL